MDPRGGGGKSHLQRRTSSPTKAEAEAGVYFLPEPARRGVPVAPSSGTTTTTTTPASGGRGGGGATRCRCALVPLMLFVVLTASVLSLYSNAVSFSKRAGAGASHLAFGRVADDEGEAPVLRQRKVQGHGQGGGGGKDGDDYGDGNADAARATIEALRRENEELRRALRDREAAAGARVNNATATSTFRHHVDVDVDGHVCYPLLATSAADGDTNMMVPSAAALWRRYLPKVFNASRHPRDPKDEFHDWTAMLLRHLTPQRLLRSVKSLPDMELFGRRVLAVLQRRRRYLAAKAKAADVDAAAGAAGAADAPEEAPPLKILVLGGSVTAGVLCRVNALNAKVGRYGRKGCAWPFRLQHFANRLLGFDAVRVESVAVGGTFTEQGGLMYQYGLLPDEAKNPDVVVNSYSSNDMHVLSVRASEAKNVTLERAVFDMTQDFIRAVSRPGCGRESDESPPLLVYLDDYVGNEQHEVLRTMAFDRAMTELANYYGIMALSYGDVVRDLVYGDSEENWFSPTWHEGGGGGDGGTKKFVRQVHHGMGGHASIVWVLVFNFLNAATVYCSELGKSFGFGDDVDVRGGAASALRGLEDNTKRRNAYRSGHGLPELHEPERFLPGEPRTPPRGLPPPLTDTLTLQNVSQLWASSSRADEAACRATATAASPNALAGGATAVGTGAGAGASDGGPCVFAWIGNLRGMDTRELLASKLGEVVLDDRSRGWEAELDNDKVGFVATGGAGSTVALRASRVARPVQLVHLLVMKSYGEKWADSRVGVSVFVSKPEQQRQVVQNEENPTPTHGGDDGVLTNTEEITGFHASNISVTYTYQIDLKENAAPIGSNLTMVIDLIEGTTFKFTGMAICGR